MAEQKTMTIITSFKGVEKQVKAAARVRMPLIVMFAAGESILHDATWFDEFARVNSDRAIFACVDTAAHKDVGSSYGVTTVFAIQIWMGVGRVAFFNAPAKERVANALAGVLEKKEGREKNAGYYADDEKSPRGITYSYLSPPYEYPLCAVTSDETKIMACEEPSKAAGLGQKMEPPT